MALTDLGSVICCTKDQLWRTVVPRANIRNIGLVLNKYFGTPKIAKLEHTSVRIEQEILRLDITMAYTLRMDICQRAE